jgi:hypothetical protein
LWSSTQCRFLKQFSPPPGGGRPGQCCCFKEPVLNKLTIWHSFPSSCLGTQGRQVHACRIREAGASKTPVPKPELGNQKKWASYFVLIPKQKTPSPGGEGGRKQQPVMNDRFHPPPAPPSREGSLKSTALGGREGGETTICYLRLFSPSPCPSLKGGES